jgi:segregation and condensation protein B
MADRKRKIVQPKRAAEAKASAEAELDESATTPDPEAERDEAVPAPVDEAEEPDTVALPPESGEAFSESDSEPDSVASEGDAGEAGDPTHELMGDGPSEVDETRVDDTGAYLKGLLEALLFVSDHPLEIKDLARAAKIDKKRAEELVQEIRADYEKRGIRLDEVGDGYAFRSNPTYSEYVRGYLSLRPVRLSRAQLETLSIVAYRQPITRPEVDDIRGVDAGPVLKGLLERDLVRIIGKKDEPGRPILYGTTQTFLQVFSLKSLRDLPTLREFTELNDESRKTFEEELGEEAPEGPISF